MTVHRIEFEGPAALAVGVATDLADAEGVDMTSSDPLELHDDGSVTLIVTVEGDVDDIRVAVSSIGSELPKGASLRILYGK